MAQASSKSLEHDVTVGEISANRAKPLLCGPADFLDETLDRMIAGNQSAVIVVEQTGQIVGLLTKDSVLRAVQAASEVGDTIAREHVFAWMTDSPVMIDQGASLTQAFTLMERQKAQEAIFMQDGRPLYILTISDVLSALHSLDASIIRNMRGMLFQPLSSKASLASHRRR